MAHAGFSSSARAGCPGHKEIPMTTQKITSLGRIVLLAIMILAVAVIAAVAQNVPATATEAARSPQFAARLAHRGAAQHTASPNRIAGACSYGRQGISPQDGFYSNGPINGNTDAWTINFGFVVADTFPSANGGGRVSGLNFGAWLFPGDVLQTVEVSITSQPFGGTTYFDQVVSFTQSTNCPINSYGYQVCTESGTFNGPYLSDGKYWVNLQNAVVNSGDPMFWDENSGPSMAEQNSVGTIPSESFTISGGGDSCMPEQDGNFKVIHDFSSGEDGGAPSGVAIDKAGNLYGPTGGGNGTVYKMAEAGIGWVLSTLYNFLGGGSGASPQGVMVGPKGILYGSASGGVQNDGLIFSLRPAPNVCRSTSCYWTDNMVYAFNGPPDASHGGGLVADQAGNLYGVSRAGGAQQQGAVFELTPSIGGWIETVLYSFTGASDGGGPTTLLVGIDGNLYGMAGGGGAFGGGVVFQLTPSSGGWTEAVLYNIPSSVFPTNPHSLLQDSAGNLFGIYDYMGCCASSVGRIFMLSPSNGNWVFTELHHGDANLDGDDEFPNMTLDPAGNLHGTEWAYSGCINTVYYGYIFELARTNNGWQFSTPIAWDNRYFGPSGALALDAHGNLYGTTANCGSFGYGTVWQLSP